MNEDLRTLITNGSKVLTQYDKELTKNAVLTKTYDLSDDNLHKVCNDVFSKVIGKPTNFSWSDCQAIIDIIERQTD